MAVKIGKTYHVQYADNETYLNFVAELGAIEDRSGDTVCYFENGVELVTFRSPEHYMRRVKKPKKNGKT